MARRRFYAPPGNIAASTVSLSADETHHLIHVLRMTPGDEAFVFDGCGREYRCNFRSIKDNRAQLEIADALSDPVESPLHLTLGQALARGEKFDFIVQKATELGVSGIAPLVTRYADVRLDDQQTTKRVERWRRISLEAMKQCGRRKLVEITAPRTIREFIVANEPSPDAASHIQRALLLFTEKGGMPVVAARGRIEALPDRGVDWARRRLERRRDGDVKRLRFHGGDSWPAGVENRDRSDRRDCFDSAGYWRSLNVTFIQTAS